MGENDMKRLTLRTSALVLVDEHPRLIAESEYTNVQELEHRVVEITLDFRDSEGEEQESVQKITAKVVG